MADLVDYLRDKLAADGIEVFSYSPPAAVCTCPDIDITDWNDRAADRRHTIKGQDPRCPEHGGGWVRE